MGRSRRRTQLRMADPPPRRRSEPTSPSVPRFVADRPPTYPPATPLRGRDHARHDPVLAAAGGPLDADRPAARGRPAPSPAPRPAGPAGGGRDDPLRRPPARPADPDRGVLQRPGGGLPFPHHAPRRDRRPPRPAPGRAGPSTGQHLVALLAAARARGIVRTRHRVRWQTGRIVLAGQDAGGIVVDLAAGTVAVDAGTAMPGAWTALAGELVDRWGLERRAAPVDPAHDRSTRRG